MRDSMNNQLKEKYGLLTAIAMVVGIVIGSGVFFKAEKVLTATGGDLPRRVMIMNAENDRYHIPPQKAAEGAGQKDETHLALALHRRLSPAAASSRSYSAAVSSLVISHPAANAANAAASCRYFSAVARLFSSRRSRAAKRSSNSV